MSNLVSGIIVKALSGFYYVETECKVIECRARGKFRNEGISPLVGDYVQIETDGKQGNIKLILDRKNQLTRPPIANIDKLFIISSIVLPSPNTLLIDRLTALCSYKNIEPVVVFNKIDSGCPDEWVKIYHNSNIKTILTSSVTLEGIDEIKSELTDNISVFTGNSGVGKSSIINCLFPNLKLSTGDVSSKLGRGRHTTRHCELFRHQYGGYIADTPGFSSLETDPNDINFKKCLADCFKEFNEYAGKCIFNNCAHIGEKGCQICSALNDNKIEPTRYNSYKTMYNEMKDIKDWNIKK